MADNKQTFDDLVAAVVEETPWDARAAWVQRQADREERQRERSAQFKSDLEACLDPVIAEATMLRYETTMRTSKSMAPYGPAQVQAVLTVDGETWTIWKYSNTIQFSFEGPQHREQSADPEKLQTALLTAIAKRRQQRASADESE
jgi:hypothetical protein